MNGKYKNIVTIGLAILLPVGIGGCPYVKQSDFDAYKADVETRLNQQSQINQNLDAHVKAVDCELNTDFISNDEPDPTRRDEPSSTRRDECKERTDALTSNPNFEACKSTLKACLADPTQTQCYQDYQTCLTT